MGIMLTNTYFNYNAFIKSGYCSKKEDVGLANMGNFGANKYIGEHILE